MDDDTKKTANGKSPWDRDHVGHVAGGGLAALLAGLDLSRTLKPEKMQVHIHGDRPPDDVLAEYLKANHGLTLDQVEIIHHPGVPDLKSLAEQMFGADKIMSVAELARGFGAGEDKVSQVTHGSAFSPDLSKGAKAAAERLLGISDTLTDADAVDVLKDLKKELEVYVGQTRFQLALLSGLALIASAETEATIRELVEDKGIAERQIKAINTALHILGD